MDIWLAKCPSLPEGESPFPFWADSIHLSPLRRPAQVYELNDKRQPDHAAKSFDRNIKRGTKKDAGHPRPRPSSFPYFPFH